MKKIKITKNKEVLVDDEDFDKVNQHKWYAHEAPSTCYARHDFSRKNKVYMHRFILGLDKNDKYDVDHIDGDGLNNQKNNLRKSLHYQNCCNQKLNIRNTTGYKGVCYFDKKYIAYIQVNKKRKTLGYYDSLEEAAKVYDEAAKKYHKEFARLNFKKEES